MSYFPDGHRQCSVWALKQPSSSSEAGIEVLRRAGDRDEGSLEAEAVDNC